jgi:hypothetical protein
MTMRTVGARRTGLLATAAITVAMIATACGGSGSSSSSTTSTSNATPAANTSSTPASTPKAHPHLAIVSPKAGAHTHQTLTIRVKLSGAQGAKPRFRYVLGSVKRQGSAAITFHGVAAGKHRLTVILASNGHVRASETFVVTAPPPPPTVTQSAPPPTTTSSPTPAPPPPTTTSAPPPPPPTTTAAPPPSNGIPQHNGGDADGDNNGGPSDGDGLI